jgi:hypothetical protein
MVAPLSANARAWWAATKDDARKGQADATWHSDHV